MYIWSGTAFPSGWSSRSPRPTQCGSRLTKSLGTWLTMRVEVKVSSWYKVPLPLTYICLEGIRALRSWPWDWGAAARGLRTLRLCLLVCASCCLRPGPDPGPCAPCALRALRLARLAPFSFYICRKKECQVDLTTWRVDLGRS